MPTPDKKRRFRFSLRTLGWLLLVAPLAVFAANEHHQRVQLDERLRLIEWTTAQSRRANEAQLKTYRSLVDSQEQKIQRYKLRLLQL